MTNRSAELSRFIRLLYNVDKEAADHATRRVTSYLSAEFGIAVTPRLKLPDVAPELYENRGIDPATGKRETAIAFYDRVWRKYTDAGVLYQDQLKKLDPNLGARIRVQCYNQGLPAHEHLPPPRYMRTDPYDRLKNVRRKAQQRYVPKS